MNKHNQNKAKRYSFFFLRPFFFFFGAKIGAKKKLQNIYQVITLGHKVKALGPGSVSDLKKQDALEGGVKAASKAKATPVDQVKMSRLIKGANGVPTHNPAPSGGRGSKDENSGRSRPPPAPAAPQSDYDYVPPPQKARPFNITGKLGVSGVKPAAFYSSGDAPAQRSATFESSRSRAPLVTSKPPPAQASVFRSTRKSATARDAVIVLSDDEGEAGSGNEVDANAGAEAGRNDEGAGRGEPDPSSSGALRWPVEERHEEGQTAVANISCFGRQEPERGTIPVCLSQDRAHLVLFASDPAGGRIRASVDLRDVVMAEFYLGTGHRAFLCLEVALGGFARADSTGGEGEFQSADPTFPAPAELATRLPLPALGCTSLRVVLASRIGEGRAFEAGLRSLYARAPGHVLRPTTVTSRAAARALLWSAVPPATVGEILGSRPPAPAPSGAAAAGGGAAPEEEVVLVYTGGGAGNRRARVTVTEADLRSLQPGEFLNDTIIDFYCQYVRHSALPEARAARCTVFTSFLFRQLSSGGTREVYEGGLSKWTSSIDLFDSELLVLPINSQLHWSLAVICDPGCVVGRTALSGPGGPCIIIFDSLGMATSRANEICRTLRTYLNLEWQHRGKDKVKVPTASAAARFTEKNMPTVVPKVPKQGNFSDCGLFVLDYAERFCMQRVDPTEDLSRWFQPRNALSRGWVLDIIESLAVHQTPAPRNLNPPPATSSASSKKRKSPENPPARTTRRTKTTLDEAFDSGEGEE
jgi:hypothetical protein